MTRQTKRAFTLIELLVVVAIIALLIAILLPSLGKARDRAKLTRCAANLNGLTKGAIVYAAEFQNLLPQMKSGGLPWSQSSSYDPTCTYVAVVGTAPNNTPVGLGMVVQAGAITDPRILFCPAQLNDAFTYDPVQAEQIGGFLNWDKATANGAGRTGYNFQIHTQVVGSGWDVEYYHTTDYAIDAVVACDQIYGSGSNSNYIAHGGVSSPSGVRFNVSFIDGHVQTIPVTTIRGVTVGHTAKSWVFQDLQTYAKPPSFATTTGNFGLTVADMDYTAAH